MTSAKFLCPCCNFLTLPEAPPGTFFICPVCGWEDDNVQFQRPDFAVGANRMSLNQAKKNFQQFGYAEERAKYLVRGPLADERPD
ncbi:MAG TPA: CPCC family cysteine-rich protein [Myxococcales bacterium]